MAYVNVSDWTTELVTDWLKGLDNSMYTYTETFTKNEVSGEQLLNIRSYELERLSMHSIGHQEIVLEAVEHLRNFHYHLNKENLQFLALQVATSAQRQHNQLAQFVDKSKIETHILNDITRTVTAIKPLIGWLDRSPFQDKQQFVELRNKMFRYAIEMATSAQRDRFVENPVDQIKGIALRVADLANYIIRDISDPMILQPAMLNLVTIKKKESELGFNIVPSYHGIHVVTDIRKKSPAHTSGKIEEGDEIVQINYQTVVGWQYKKVMKQLHDSPPDIILTLKKRPKHSKIHGQVNMKPFRLPSKKKQLHWDSSPGPCSDLPYIQDFPLPLTHHKEEQAEFSDDDIVDDGDDILDPKSEKSSEKKLRLCLPKTRAVLQRRNTICGDHSAHCRFSDISRLKGSMPDICDKELSRIEVDVKDEDNVSECGISKVARFNSAQAVSPHVDDGDDLTPKTNKINQQKCHGNVPPKMPKMMTDNGLIETVNKVVVNDYASRQERQHKVHGTPIDDDTDEDSGKFETAFMPEPPAIKPRKKFVHEIAPVPPPRPARPKKLIAASPTSPASNTGDMPTPTVQHRTYQRLPGNARLQAGTKSMISSTGENSSVQPVLSSQSLVAAVNKNEAPKEASITAIQATKSTQAESTPLHRYQKGHTHHERRKFEFDFPASKILNFFYPKVNPLNRDIHGFITLKDLMTQKEEEDAQEMYNNRVSFGVEKKSRRNKESNDGDCCEQTTPNKIQSRRLPKTPDYSYSFKSTDSDIMMIRSSEGLKLRAFGYEEISESESVGRSSATNSDDTKPFLDKISLGKKNGLNWIKSTKNQ